MCRELDKVTKALSDTCKGLPTMVGTDRSDCFHHHVDKVCQWLEIWKENTLSIHSKEILTKSIAQVIPSYAMQIFKLQREFACP